MVRSARTLALCALAAFAALLLAASPAAAQNRVMFTASLNPLVNTTGVNLGGNGFARVAFNTGASNAPRGDNQFTLDVNNLARPGASSHAAPSESATDDARRQGSSVVAVHIHKGLPNENGARSLMQLASRPPVRRS
jgi:hypothetical protein